MDKDKMEFSKLSGDNYSAWKFKMKLLLIHKGYWKAVTGEKVSEETDQKALAIIGLGVGDEQIIHIQDSETSKEAWDNLSKIYENAGTANKMHLQEQLMTSKMGSEDSVKGHIEKLRRIVGQLATMGVIVSDEQYILTLLRSLPARFESLVVTLENMVESLKLEDIHARIIREEARQGALRENSNDEGALLQAHRFRRKVIVCHYCKRRGHIARKCWKKIEDQRRNGHRESIHLSQTQALVANADTKGALEGTWFIDSGASYHMVSSPKWVNEGSMKQIEPVEICLGNGTIVRGKKTGDIDLVFKTDQGWYPIQVQNVLIVPEIKANLLSVGAIQDKGHSVIFERNRCIIRKSKTKELMLSIMKTGTTYKITGRQRKRIQPFETAYSGTEASHMTRYSDYWLWHARLGHIGEKALRKISSNQIASGVPRNLQNDDERFVCEGCAEGRMHSHPFNSLKKLQTSRPLELIHSDVCGPMPGRSKGGSRYFVTFIDDHTRRTFVYFIRSKDQVEKRFREFKSLVENQLQCRIKGLRSDNGGEYISYHLKDVLRQAGIVHETSAPYCPQQNGTAERANRTIIEKARCMLRFSGLDDSFWAEAVATSVYIKNRSPTAIIGHMTPEEAWTGTKPDLSHLKVFGCPAFVHEKRKRGKWQPTSIKCIFIGYLETVKNYKFYNPNTRRIIISLHAEFDEHELWRISIKIKEYLNSTEKAKPTVKPANEKNCIDVSDEESSESEEQKSVEVTVNEPATPNAGVQSVRRSARHSTPPERLTYVHPSDEEDHAAVAMLADKAEPCSVEDALTSPEREYWRHAMKSELKSLLENDTWTLKELPKGRSALKCKWIFRLKPETGNQPTIYKARLVAKGYEQIHGVDYMETFSPVVKLSSVRALLALAVHEGHFVHQMDVKTAFLNGSLEEDIYMEQPESFVNQKFPSHVCHLKKAIYGLKQAPRSWYKTIDPVLHSMGVVRSKADNGIYSGIVRGERIRIALYVDDIIITCSNLRVLAGIKRTLESHFSMKDLGCLRHCLGIEVTYNQEAGVMKLSQTKAIEEVLKRFRMTMCKEVSTPMECNYKPLTVYNDNEIHKSTPYRSAVGSLMYIMLGTRPDISYAVGVLSRFLERPGNHHWQALKRVFRYLKGTSQIGLTFKRTSDPKLTGFSDADWASDVDRKSISGYAFLLGNAAISWASKKQSTIALSSTESETIAITEASKEAEWLRKLLDDLRNEETGIIMIRMDNQSSMALSKREGHHGRTKHIDVRHLYVQSLVENEKIKLEYCPTEYMAADFLTKPLPRVKHSTCARILGLSDAQD